LTISVVSEFEKGLFSAEADAIQTGIRLSGNPKIQSGLLPQQRVLDYLPMEHLISQ